MSKCWHNKISARAFGVLTPRVCAWFFNGFVTKIYWLKTYNLSCSVSFTFFRMIHHHWNFANSFRDIWNTCKRLAGDKKPFIHTLVNDNILLETFFCSCSSSCILLIQIVNKKFNRIHNSMFCFKVELPWEALACQEASPALFYFIIILL